MRPWEAPGSDRSRAVPSCLYPGPPRKWVLSWVVVSRVTIVVRRLLQELGAAPVCQTLCSAES